MRPSGGIPGSGAGRSQLAGGPGQLTPLQAQEGPGGQQGKVNRPYPGHTPTRTRIGKVRTKERTDKLLELFQSKKARILSATISRDADRWFVSLTCEVERPNPEPRKVQGPEDVVGIDVGLEAFAVLSDGTRIEAPKPLGKALRLLKRRSKQLSRKQKKTVVARDPETGEERKRTVFSRNYEKAALRLARLHRHIRNIRQDFLHKVTTELVKAKPVLVVEDLNVARNGSLSRAILDVGWGAFRRMLEYKCAW